PLVDDWCRSWGTAPLDLEPIRRMVFAAANYSIDSFREQPGTSFRGWLWAIARNQFIERQRERATPAPGSTAVNVRLPARPEHPAADNPEQTTALHHRALELIRGNFDEQTWEAFRRCAVDGRSPVDVAQELGMTPATVRKVKARVLRRLKD